MLDLSFLSQRDIATLDKKIGFTLAGIITGKITAIMLHLQVNRKYCSDSISASSMTV